ncbi:hypothetical protein JTE90_023169 [Oedothorax gibbosus]|uniref:Uncharacterized protein n=1 Tax=Oedothorax gibbosus TaxID=931172 RepID=A0AAV6TPP9_9ARAC|nr:hypothetical protein JTE90_023169 [Oedothorax gibbosus]
MGEGSAPLHMNVIGMELAFTSVSEVIGHTTPRLQRKFSSCLRSKGKWVRDLPHCMLTCWNGTCFYSVSEVIGHTTPRLQRKFFSSCLRRKIAMGEGSAPLHMNVIGMELAFTSVSEVIGHTTPRLQRKFFFMSSKQKEMGEDCTLHANVIGMELAFTRSVKSSGTPLLDCNEFFFMSSRSYTVEWRLICHTIYERDWNGTCCSFGQ